ncbi:hypothetical protein PIB30_077619 [Stylosanthes scabra]|uniref:Uncharacterized protein n=1 Tax=Stylosanthes scabra TaxID=79078 RepID=A0ABU6XP12_9FABA|nr:hypothetical protein [Stylosanthes scabra]
MADNNQYFKTRATTITKGVFEAAPSESTILATELADSDYSDDELANSDDSDDEEVEEEPGKDVDTKVVEEETKCETFFIATIFSRNKVAETEILIKCEDPGPCLVT